MGWLRDSGHPRRSPSRVDPRWPNSASYLNAILADAPLLVWKLDEKSGTAAADASGNSRTGTYTGSPSLASATPYPDGKAAPYFDGSRVEGDANVVSDGTWTIECWFNRDAHKTGQTAGINSLIGDLVSTSNGVMVRWDGDVSTLRAYVAFGGNYFQVDVTAGYDSIHHYALTSTGSLVTAYLDGVEVSSTSVGSAGFDLKWQAAGISSGGGQSMYMKGSVGWVAVYPTALTLARIAAHYAAA